MAEEHTHMDDDHIHPLSRRFLWLADEKVVKGFIWLPAIGLAVSIALGLHYDFPEKHKALWDFFGSWGLIGFMAYSFVVLCAKPLFAMLARQENYYGEEVVPEDIIEPVVEVHHHD